MNDLISRAAAIEAIKPLLYSGNCVSTLINMPAVDAVQVVHGWWEPCNDYNGYCRCSKCHDVYIDPAWQIDGKWAFCPHCGAKMDGGERDG